MCDVALDPYTSHGHDGILKNNYVDNDETIKILVKICTREPLKYSEARGDMTASKQGA